jgi:photosystem II stability/assembly factor-like uncharacterized protein
MKYFYIAFFYSFFSINYYKRFFPLIILLCFINPSFPQSIDGDSWKWQYPKPQGNTLRDIYVFNQNTAIAVGDFGTVIKTANGGTNWDVQHHVGGTDVGLNCVHFIDELNGWAVGGNVLLKTGDGGKTWYQLKTDTTLGYNSVYFIDADTGFVFGEDGIILRTTNGGISWDTHSIDDYIGLYLDVFRFNAVMFVDKQTGFLIGYGYYGNEIYKTTDCGRTWQWNEQIIMPKIYTDLKDINFIDKNNGFIVSDAGIFLKTTDGGNSWQRDSIVLAGYSVFFTDTITGWVATWEGYILKTTDGGTNWTAINSNPITNNGLLKVRFYDQNYGWFIGGAGTIYRTTDAGNNWIDQRQKEYKFNSIYFINESIGWAVGDSAIILYTTDGGDNWQRQNYQDSIQLLSIYAINSQDVFAVGAFITGLSIFDRIGVIFKTTNSGETWAKQRIDSVYEFNSIAFINDSTGWMSGTSGILLKTTNKGNTWVKIVLDTSISKYKSALGKIQFVNQSIGWIGLSYLMGEQVYGSILKTTDGGNSWNVQNIPSLSSPSFYFVNEQSGWMIGDSIGISKTYKTTNGGANWTLSGSTYPDYSTNIFFNNEYIGWIAEYSYVNQKSSITRTTDGGNTWVSQNIPSSGLTDLLFLNENTGWATGQEGIFKTINGGVSGIKNICGYSPSIPKEIELYQNFPNPFNPSTIIEYRLTSRQQIKLQIFNILGQEISSLVNELQNEGSYKINWNPGKISSGVYFYRLTTPSQGIVKKMLFIR